MVLLLLWQITGIKQKEFLGKKQGLANRISITVVEEQFDRLPVRQLDE